VGDSTMKEELKTLRRLNKVFEQLKEEADAKDAKERARGRVDTPRPFTVDPRSIGRREIQAFMAYMRNRRLDPVTQVKYLKHLKNFLRVFKNHIIEDMAADGVRFPKAPKKPIHALALEDMQTIFNAADTLPKWHGSVARGMLAIYFATGVRPSELRLARFKDLDMKEHTLNVEHPKGEGSWASSAPVDLIRPDMEPIIERYLREREEHIKEAEYKDALALFPNLYVGQDAFYSATAFKDIKKEVEVASGVRFKIKDLRPTLTSITVNGDMSLLPAMSAQLRHSNLATTQRSYYAMQQGVAGKKLRESYRTSGLITTQQGVIENESDVSG